MMEKLSREAENLIIDAVSAVSERVSSGLEPTEAAIKVAEDKQLQPGYIQLVAQAYNIGATNQHREAQDTVLGKAASFKLINPKDVIKARYPAEVKSAAAGIHAEAVASDYDAPPRWVQKRASALATRAVQEKEWAMTEKTASAYPVDPTLEISKSISQEIQMRKQAEAARGAASRAYDQIIDTTSALRLYFKQVAPPVSFKEAKANCELQYGDRVKPLFSRLVETNPEFAKVAEANSVLGPMVGQPYNLIQTWLTKVAEFKKAHDAYQSASKEAQSAVVVNPYVQRPSRPLHVLDGVVSLSEHSGKEAAVPPANAILQPAKPKKGPNRPDPLPSSLEPPKKPKLLTKNSAERPWLLRTGQMYNQLAPLFASAPSAPKADLATVNRMAYDPEAEQEISNIQTAALVNDMLLNDEVISGYDPNEVATMYNELRNFAPEVAQQPAAARAFLRKHLAQGQVDPYDLDLVASLENKLRKRDEQHMNVQTNLAGAKVPGAPGGPSDKDKE